MTNDVLVLAVSDNKAMCDLVSESFDRNGYTTICVPTASQALRFLEATELHVGIVLLDVTQARPEANSVLPLLSRRTRNEIFGLVTNPGDSSWAEFAIKWRVKMVCTPVSLPHDVDGLMRIARNAGAEQKVDPSTAPESDTTSPVPYHLEELDKNRFFLAGCPSMMQVYRDIRIFAPLNLPVLILGESGVGKENVARLLHKYHPRSEKSLLSVNCAALPNELLESELFGYEAGAFTGANKAKPGIFDLAHKGTLLLDEIGEMSPKMQAKLLHVLQDGSFSRLGARSSSQVDVRVLAATNVNIEQAISKKRFREDLYYRLNALTITVPSLHERREEIPFLLREMFRRGALELGQSQVDTEAMIEAAQDYSWPGNLRELRNFVTRTLVLQDEKTACQYLRTKTRASGSAQSRPSLRVAPQTIQKAETSSAATGMKDAVSVIKNEMEARMLREALSASGWNRRTAAKNLSISYRTLLYKIQQHGLRA